ncbi:MAG: hypothetical protein ACI8VW_003164 [bacterium]|jgi:hypothetical protein
MKTAAIMQPTLMPWLGYFALMDAVDIFIYLDDVQYVKRSWQSRNRIKSPQGELMLSLAIAKQTTTSTIQHVRLSESNNHEKFIKCLNANLGKAPYFEFAKFVIQQSYDESEGYLAKFNIGITERIADAIGIKTERHFASNLSIEPMEKASRLLAFCKTVHADSYLSPIGSYSYLNESNPFDNSGVKLWFHNYSHPTYTQAFGEFAPYMAGIDALSWVGPENFLSLIRTGNRAPQPIEQLQIRLAA